VNWKVERTPGCPVRRGEDGRVAVPLRLSRQGEHAADAELSLRAVLGDRRAGEYALRRALWATTQVLADVLRVADSRGTRLHEWGEGP
jgi:hypothetical protein